MKLSKKRVGKPPVEGVESSMHTEQVQHVVGGIVEAEESSEDEEVVVVEGDIMTHKAIEIVPKEEKSDRQEDKQHKRANKVAKHVKFRESRALTGGLTRMKLTTKRCCQGLSNIPLNDHRRYCDGVFEIYLLHCCCSYNT